MWATSFWTVGIYYPMNSTHYVHFRHKINKSKLIFVNVSLYQSTLIYLFMHLKLLGKLKQSYLTLYWRSEGSPTSERLSLEARKTQEEGLNYVGYLWLLFRSV